MCQKYCLHKLGDWSILYSNFLNCNWGTCIVPPTRRPRTHHRVNPYPGARRQNETECFQIMTKQVRRSQQFQLRR